MSKRILTICFLIFAISLMIAVPSYAAIVKTDIVLSPISNDPVSPGDTSAVINYTLNANATSATVTIMNKLNSAVKRSNIATPLAGAHTYTWNLTDNSLRTVPDGFYSYKVGAVPTTLTYVYYKSNTVTNVTGFTLARLAPTIEKVVYDTLKPFTPKGTNTYSFDVRKISEPGTVVLGVYSDIARTTLVRSFTQSFTVATAAYSFKWNGKDGGGSIVADGMYYFEVNFTDASGNAIVPLAGGFELIKTPPVITATPIAGPITDSTPVNIDYTLSKDVKTVDVNVLDNVTYRTVFKKSFTSANDESKTGATRTVTWDLKNQSIKLKTGGYADAADGIYRYKIKVKDRAGFVDEYVSPKFRLGRFNPAITDVVYSTVYFKATGANYTPISFKISERATVLAKVYDGGGSLVSTIFNRTVNGGKQTIYWGAKVGGVVVADGTYTIQLSATDVDGNVTNASAIIKVHSSEPVITNDTISTLGVFSCDLSENGYVTVKIIERASGRTVKTLTTSKTALTMAPTVTWTTPIAGSYMYSVYATDMVGLKSDTEYGYVTIP